MILFYFYFSTLLCLGLSDFSCLFGDILTHNLFTAYKMSKLSVIKIMFYPGGRGGGVLYSLHKHMLARLINLTVKPCSEIYFLVLF